MKFQLSSEIAPGEFVGRSAEEAVDRARVALGAGAKVRCWKTRRGGVLGFFAREVFIAGVNEPNGRVAVAERDGDQKTTRTASAESRLSSSTSSASVPIGLDDLIASTTDEVSYGSSEDTAAEREFGDVLAQAEAALSDLVFDDAAWNGGETIDAEPAVEMPPRDEVEEFRGSLGSLGVPAWYQPLEHEGALDGLAKSLRDLPPPPTLPMTPGSVIVVVGSRREAETVAREIAEHFDLADNDVIALTDDAAVRRRIARRKKSTRVSVVIVAVSPSGRSLSAASESIARVAPDYVLGAVPATLKCSDVDRWSRELGVTAIALRRWNQTETPAELVSALPVLSVDGVMMTTLRWVSLLLTTYLERNEST